MTRTLLAVLAGLAFTPLAHADHSWNDYHWARTTSSFDLIVFNSTTAQWDGFVSDALADWSQSNAVRLVEELGDNSRKTRRQCRGGTGTVRVCNLEYGNNGWLGIAGISLDSNGHIVTGYTKLNDTYFSPDYGGGYYYTADWMQSVACQEVGHDLGLGHQDEDFNNTSLKTCMDYQDPPWPTPNAHDYQELGDIYAHLDSYDSYATGEGGDDGGNGNGNCGAPPGKGCNKAEPGWGVSMGVRGNTETFVRRDRDGMTHVTFVTWVE